MCGIVGYIGNKDAVSVLIGGLKSLEYRGYDSSGISILDSKSNVSTYKSAGKLNNLEEQLKTSNVPTSTIGVAHTRWATHGEPTQNNAHPHSGSGNNVFVVHNGIVENFSELRSEIENSGSNLNSDTDSETIPHLIESYLSQSNNLEEAVMFAAKKIKGANSIVVMSKKSPEKIIALRTGHAGGIIVGHAADEMLVASDLPALIPYTNKVTYLDGGEMVVLTKTKATFFNLDGQKITKPIDTIDYNSSSAEKGNYEHFMLKEINEQPESITSSLRGRILFDESKVTLPDFPLTNKEISNLERIVIVGMGTSLHAAMIARTWIEQISGIPAEWDNSSEFRYRNPIIKKNTLFISISQSGETADTLAAMEKAKDATVKQLTLCNYMGSQATRVADGTLELKAGLEIGVAATKTFICSLSALYMLAIYLGQERNHLKESDRKNLVNELTKLPDLLGRTLKISDQIEKIADKFHSYSDFLFLGRGINYPIAMEGALKLKEISYIHAEGYPAGEMKHGPISLIDDNMPIVALIPQDSLYEKMLSNISEAKSRGGTVIAIASEKDSTIADKVDHVISVPDASELLNPLLITLPLQLLSYHIAVKRECDIDQPRNLAKSVTVE